MCKSNCDHPELRPKDGKCSKELIEKCHGKNKNHPCNEKDEKKDNKFNSEMDRNRV